MRVLWKRMVQYICSLNAAEKHISEKISKENLHTSVKILQKNKESGLVGNFIVSYHHLEIVLISRYPAVLLSTPHIISASP